MIASDFSFVIPVYNRPEEVRELLESFCELEVPKTFEIVIVEDGSSLDARLIIEHFQAQLNISYYYKENTVSNHRCFGKNNMEFQAKSCLLNTIQTCFIIK